MSKLNELLEKEFIGFDELAEIEEHEDVTQVEDCGMSGKYIDYHWYNVVTINGLEYSVYVK